MDIVEDKDEPEMTKKFPVAIKKAENIFTLPPSQISKEMN